MFPSIVNQIITLYCWELEATTRRKRRRDHDTEIVGCGLGSIVWRRYANKMLEAVHWSNGKQICACRCHPQDTFDVDSKGRIYYTISSRIFRREYTRNDNSSSTYIGSLAVDFMSDESFILCLSDDESKIKTTAKSSLKEQEIQITDNDPLHRPSPTYRSRNQSRDGKWEYFTSNQKDSAYLFGHNGCIIPITPDIKGRVMWSPDSRSFIVATKYAYARYVLKNVWLDTKNS